MTCKEYYYNLVKKNSEKIINIPNEYKPILDNEQNIDDLINKWLEKENKYKQYMDNMNKIILDQNQNIDDLTNRLLEKENKYKQYIDNMNKIILDQNQKIDDLTNRLLEKEKKMISIHNKQIQNLTMKYQKQIEKLLNKNPMKLIYY
jgi:hypothetical protein